MVYSRENIATYGRRRKTLIESFDFLMNIENNADSIKEDCHSAFLT